MKTYRSKRPVEAMQWTGENCEEFAAFHERYMRRPPEFIGNGVRILTNPHDDVEWRIEPHRWVVWFAPFNEFHVLTDAQFRAEYEEVTT